MTEKPNDDARPEGCDIGIVHHIRTQLVAVTAEAMQQIATLCRTGRAMKVRDDATFERGDEINKQMRSFLRDLESHRKLIKQPVLDLGRSIDSACKEAVQPLTDASTRLSTELMRYQREQEEERSKQEAERKRELERIAKANQAAAREAVVGDTSKSRTIADEAADAMHKATAGPVPAPVKSKSVHAVRRKALRITDISLLPVLIESPSGTVFRLLTPDHAAIRKAIEAGAKVLGAVLEEVDGIASSPGA